MFKVPSGVDPDKDLLRPGGHRAGKGTLLELIEQVLWVRRPGLGLL